MNALELSQPHDRLFKELLDHLKSAARFMQERMPKDVVSLLRLATIQREEGSFQDEHLQAYFSDRLFKTMTIHNEEAFIYTLVEHKSWFDPWVPLQLMNNMVRLLNWFVQNERKRLPPVVAVLVYHGATEWKMANEFLALVDADEILRPYMLNFRFVLVDLGRIPDDQLSQDHRLRAGLLALKYAHKPEEQRRILELIALELIHVTLEFFMQILRYLIAVYESVDEHVIREVIKKARPEEETKMMSIFAQELITKGRQEGRLDGLREGEQIGEAKFLNRLLTRRFGTPPSWVLELINSASTDTLEMWTDRVLDDCSMEDVFGPNPSN